MADFFQVLFESNLLNYASSQKRVLEFYSLKFVALGFNTIRRGKKTNLVLVLQILESDARVCFLFLFLNLFLLYTEAGISF